MESYLNFENAVDYHYDQFPPKELDYARLIKPLAKATDAIARFDQMLKNMHNSEVLLAPLKRQEAVISSRMEGTVSTLDEILRYEADNLDNKENSFGNARTEVIETFLYHRAMRTAQTLIEDGYEITEWFLRSIHKELLSIGRGAIDSPGQFKTEQNYLADRTRRKIQFIPIKPEKLMDGMGLLLDFIENNPEQILLKAAITHIEFEALHPFKDGNGRIGRMLIPILLWQQKVISAPHFYISSYLEEAKDEYIDKMRNVSKHGDWTSWCVFFLEALEQQAIRNLKISEDIRSLYEEMKDIFRESLASQWHASALDFVFSSPVFRNSTFTRCSGIPSASAARFSRILAERGLLSILEEPSGRRAALYSFDPLLEIVRG